MNHNIEVVGSHRETQILKIDSEYYLLVAGRCVGSGEELEPLIYKYMTYTDKAPSLSHLTKLLKFSYLAVKGVYYQPHVKGAYIVDKNKVLKLDSLVPYVVSESIVIIKKELLNRG